METKFKDVAHLYLGCEGIWIRGRYPHKKGDKQPIDLDTLKYFVKTSYVKPVLRKLGSMSAEEAKQCFVIDGGNERDFTRGGCDGHFIQVGYTHQGKELSFLYSTGKLPVKMFPYLLKQNFDLFGLIESGEAVNKEQGVQESDTTKVK